MLDHLHEVEAAGRIPALPTILSMMARTAGVRLTVLARVTEDHWIACAVEDRLASGVAPGTRVEDSNTLCHKVFRSGRSIAVNDVDLNPLCRDDPLLKARGVNSVISVPVVLPDGTFFGTLAGFDPEPRIVDTPEVVGSIELLGELVAFHLAAELELMNSQHLLATERHVAELREQFIAVLGHDLRNPLAAVAAGAKLLARRPDRSREIVGRMNDSILRMTGLIDEVLDFARGRLGGGLGLEIAAEVSIGSTIEHVIHELQTAYPGRIIDVDLKLDRPIRCDPSRIGQLVSNLLGNALAHGDADVPVVVRGANGDGQLEFSVSNGGAPIPEFALSKLFDPFVRATSGSDRKGLGLGLYIASQIASGHGGTLEVRSDREETRFTFRMPLSVGAFGMRSEAEMS